MIRSMIERVELRPRDEGQGLDAVLFGDLAAILAACSGPDKQKLPGPFRDPGSRLSVVAGTRNHLYRTTVFRPLAAARRASAGPSDSAPSFV